MEIEHKANPLHVMCRFTDSGLSMKHALRFARWYETWVWRWVQSVISGQERKNK